MDEALYRKSRQHRDLRMLLLNTYPYELVYVEPTDAYGEWRGRGSERVRQVARARARSPTRRGGHVSQFDRSFSQTTKPTNETKKWAAYASF
jgi:hypothetical protein